MKNRLSRPSLSLHLAAVMLFACAINTSSYAYTRVNLRADLGANTVSLSGSNDKALRVCPGATLTLYNTGTTTKPSTYATSSGTVKANPTTANSLGEGYFYVGNGTYDVLISGCGMTRTITGVAIVGSGSISLSVTSFGCAGDGTTDDTTCFDDVIAFANANGSLGSGGKETTRFVISVPDGVYSIPSGLANAISVDNVWWIGTSPDGSIIKGQTGTIFKWGSASQIYGGGMRDIKFYYTAADTGALCIDAYNSAHLSFEGIRLRDVGTFAKIGDLAASKTSNSTRFRDVMGYVKNLGVPTFDLQNGAGFYLTDSVVNTNGVAIPVGTDAHTALAGQTLINAQGGWDTAMITDVNSLGYYYNLYLDPAAGKHLRNWYVANSFFDYSAEGIVLRAVNGNIRNINFTSVWSTATDGDSFRLEGNGSRLLQNINFVACIAIISGRHGWNIEKGDRVTIDGACESIGQGRLVTGYGVYLNSDPIANLVQNIEIIGGRHGIDGAPISAYTPLQADYGIKVNASALRYTVRNVRADGITAPFSFADPIAQAASCIVKENRRDDGAKPAYATSAAIVVPASTVAYTNTSPFTRHYYFSGGTVTEIKKGAVVVATDTNAFIELRPGEAWTATYAVVPTVIEDVVP